MLSKFRIPLIILICLALFISIPSPIWAKSDGIPNTSTEPSINISGFGVSPMMVYINRVSTGISIDTYGQTTASGSIFGYQYTTDEVWIYLYLERYVNGSWQTFNSWSGTYYTFYGYLQGTDVVPHGSYYRVKGSYYAWSGSNYEHIYGYSSTIYY